VHACWSVLFLYQGYDSRRDLQIQCFPISIFRILLVSLRTALLINSPFHHLNCIINSCTTSLDKCSPNGWGRIALADVLHGHCLHLELHQSFIRSFNQVAALQDAYAWPNYSTKLLRNQRLCNQLVLKRMTWNYMVLATPHTGPSLTQWIPNSSVILLFIHFTCLTASPWPQPSPYNNGTRVQALTML
jgi:hypothetical protein